MDGLGQLPLSNSCNIADSRLFCTFSLFGSFVVFSKKFATNICVRRKVELMTCEPGSL